MPSAYFPFFLIFSPKKKAWSLNSFHSSMLLPIFASSASDWLTLISTLAGLVGASLPLNALQIPKISSRLMLFKQEFIVEHLNYN